MILINLCKMFHLLTSGFDNSFDCENANICVSQENTYFTLII